MLYRDPAHVLVGHEGRHQCHRDHRGDPDRPLRPLPAGLPPPHQLTVVHTESPHHVNAVSGRILNWTRSGDRRPRPVRSIRIRPDADGESIGLIAGLVPPPCVVTWPSPPNPTNRTQPTEPSRARFSPGNVPWPGTSWTLGEDLAEGTECRHGRPPTARGQGMSGQSP
ncbi:hypothetical protein FRACA_10122 [Frankia canadensis]|uniref:Uncharacterized protein n=1 Tax=Frankia canadensis TaxID=1836972 RepID=A0A2I2KI84_9ACTN|nr:hypothetical protein FRACA_10122 [Frankia canadensis]SOU52653.1 hypothetical protein FRACA_10122 [Frankia canadensis]